jgi:hypothetical protein
VAVGAVVPQPGCCPHMSKDARSAPAGPRRPPPAWPTPPTAPCAVTAPRAGSA